MAFGKATFDVVFNSICFMAVLANLVVIAVICKVKTLHKKENAFIVSMAVSDILQIVVSYLDEYPFVQNYHWAVWMSMRLLYPVSYTTSMFAICGLSLFKYIRIKYTFRYPSIVTKKVVKISVFLVWAVPIVQFSFFLSIVVNCDKGVVCSTVFNTVYILSIGMAVYLPCLLMIYLYCRLYFCSRQHLQNLPRLAPACPKSNNNRAVLTIGAIMGSFIVCWMPKVILENAFLFFELSNYLAVLLTLLSIIGPMTNALVYSLMDTKFKDGFKSLF